MIGKIFSVCSGLSDLTAYLQGREKMPRSVLLKKYNAIYLPIPKVACTSLLRICAELLDIDHEVTKSRKQADVHNLYFPSARPLRKNKFPKKSFYKSNYDQYFKFTFSRNPWDRLVSCYENKIHNPSFNWLKRQYNIDKMEFNQDMSFEEFAEIVCEIPDTHAEKHFRSQYTFIMDFQMKPMFDFIGKFEFLDRDMNYVFDRLGIVKKQIPHEMKSSSSNYRDYYTRALEKKVSNRYSQDITLFGYEF